MNNLSSHFCIGNPCVICFPYGRYWTTHPFQYIPEVHENKPKCECHECTQLRNNE